MKKNILFLPFLQLPSGHHQAAHALIEGIQQINPNIQCEKVDILAYSYGKIESIVSKVYLNWIYVFPQIYNNLYKLLVYRRIEDNKRYRLYEWLFIPFVKKLIEDKKPDLIICTHSLPAYIINILKSNNELQIPVINVYTDYFIHSLWGVEHIDYHFVSSVEIKEILIKKGIQKEKVFITGIPIHPKISKQTKNRGLLKKTNYSILVSGGNLGVGVLEPLLKKASNSIDKKQLKLYVLCGKNVNLYKKLKELNKDYLIPLKYIDCRERMNQLYNQMDAIITKPGGVTISESLFKRIPIFIINALPGQEEINLEKLMNMGLVFHMEMDDIVEQLIGKLNDKKTFLDYQSQVDHYHSQLDQKDPSEIIIEYILSKSGVDFGSCEEND
ncbi:glycosyltransferase [Pseudogracilibacillus sp. SE30717A]|uniref:MGDG synthase family glycosyltransferase n=1 Tax=Pseudogracilibacillus sp. SE30717A TaxID=3098293 RepID=UPI00300E1EFA